METSFLIILDLSHFRGKFLPAIHIFANTNKQTKENQHFNNVGLISFSWDADIVRAFSIWIKRYHSSRWQFFFCHFT